jgi:DNA polymerase-1
MSLDDVRTLHLVETTDDAMDCLRWLSTKDKIGYDTETTGLKPERDRVRLVQIGDKHEGWAIPFEMNSMLVHDIVKRFEGTYLMFNAPFDVAMSRASGVNIPITRVEDVRLKCHVLSSTGPLALKPLCAMRVDPSAAELQTDLEEVFHKHHWNWTTIPWTFPQYWQYGALDPVLTWQLDEIVDPEVQRIAPASYDLEMSVAWPVERMMRNGMFLDRPYVQGYLGELTERRDDLFKICFDQFGIRPGSNVQVAAMLERDGVKLLKMTPAGVKKAVALEGRGLKWTAEDGVFAMDKYVLADIVEEYDHPLARAVLEYRKVSKMTGTYLEPYLSLPAADGRIHPSINTVGGVAKNPFENGGERGVRTGRMSANDPNVQNVPMRTDEGKRIRRSFKAMCSERCGCGEEHVWMKCDFDQIEQRVMAHMSGDEGMKEAFRGPVDFFVAMGVTLFDEPDFRKSDDRRQLIKNAAYADIYGAGPDKFAITAGLKTPDGDWDVEAAAGFMRMMHSKYPGPPRFTKKVIKKANDRFNSEGSAYVRSPLTGRKMVADPGKFYALVNYEIQMMAGELLKMKINEADAAGLGQYMVLAVHDEIDLDVPRSEVENVTEILREVFNDDRVISVPVTASIETGPNWGELKELES